MKHCLLIILAMFVFFSCSEKETWTTDAQSYVEFSADTVAFDTLISTVGSATKTLSVYNRNKEGIRLSQVYLGQKAKSPFRVNVDGQYLYDGVGEDFEIRHGDSIVVRVEVTPPATGVDSAMQYQDDLYFQLESGITQRVHLTVGSLDAIFMRGVVLDRDTTLCAGKPYVIYDSLVVAQGVHLTLEPGATLMFHDKAGLEVYGTVHVQGTIGEPVVFRGDRTDHMFDYLLYDNTPNRWAGIHLREGSQDNCLYNCDIHSGDYGIICDSTALDTTTLYMENCIVHNIGGDGLQLNNCVATILNTQISNTLGTTVYIFGGAYQFDHCTIAQFYPFSSDRKDALYLANQVGDNYRHLYFAYFLNSVITGYAEDVIMGSITEGQDYTCDYLFDHCYLKTVATDDTVRFAHIIYDDKDQELQSEKNFRLFDTTNFLYDFTPDSLSQIRSLADPQYTTLPYDRLGRNRFLDEGPDAGCYEYIAE